MVIVDVNLTSLRCSKRLSYFDNSDLATYMCTRKVKEAGLVITHFAQSIRRG